MVQKRLLNYVKTYLSRGYPAQSIRMRLLRDGWTSKEINEAIKFLQQTKTITPNVQKGKPLLMPPPKKSLVKKPVKNLVSPQKQVIKPTITPVTSTQKTSVKTNVPKTPVSKQQEFNKEVLKKPGTSKKIMPSKQTIQSAQENKVKSKVIKPDVKGILSKATKGQETTSNKQDVKNINQIPEQNKQEGKGWTVVFWILLVLLFLVIIGGVLIYFFNFDFLPF